VNVLSRIYGILSGPLEILGGTPMVQAEYKVASYLVLLRNIFFVFLIDSFLVVVLNEIFHNSRSGSNPNVCELKSKLQIWNFGLSR